MAPRPREARAEADGWEAVVTEGVGGAPNTVAVSSPDGMLWVTNGDDYECSPSGAMAAALWYRAAHEAGRRRR